MGSELTNHYHDTTGSHFEIPETCKAGVCIEEGPNFKMTVDMVPVPEPGNMRNHCMADCKINTSTIGPDEVLIKLNATGICFSGT